MAIPIGLQLYTVRDLLGKDFEGTLAQIAKIGYKNVEFAGLYERKASDVRKLLDKLGLKACSAHINIDGKPETLQRHIDDARVLGYDVIISGLPSWNMEKTAAEYRKAVKTLCQAAKDAKAQGISYAYHNHSFEFQRFADADNKSAMEIIFDESNPPLAAELDVYWVQHGNDDPIKWIKKLAGRVPCLHIKDMEKGAGRGFAEVGTGIVDMKAVVAAAPAAGVRYLIIEQDSNWVKGDPLESVRISLENFRKIAS